MFQRRKKLFRRWDRLNTRIISERNTNATSETGRAKTKTSAGWVHWQSLGTRKRLFLLQIGPSTREFLLALLVLVWGIVRGLGSLNPACQTLGMVSPIVALFLALDAVRVWRVLSMPGRVAASLFILLLGTAAWKTLAEAAQALFPAGR